MVIIKITDEEVKIIAKELSLEDALINTLEQVKKETGIQISKDKLLGDWPNNKMLTKNKGAWDVWVKRDWLGFSSNDKELRYAQEFHIIYKNKDIDKNTEIFITPDV